MIYLLLTVSGGALGPGNLLFSTLMKNTLDTASLHASHFEWDNRRGIACSIFEAIFAMHDGRVL